MKKAIIAIIIAALIIGIGITMWLILKDKEDTKRSILKDKDDSKAQEAKMTMKTIYLNEEMTLGKGETVTLEDEDVYLTIKEFTYSPAPEGTQAFWSGLGVTYELKIGSETYTSDIQGFFNEFKNIPYEVVTIDSDYKTYATVKIEENKQDGETLIDSEISEMQEVDDYIDKILNDEEFNSLSKEERISFMEKELKKLATEGTKKFKKPLIKKDSIYIDEENNHYNVMISFEYACGVLGGVMIPSETKLTYKINNEIGSSGSRYSERGIYYDTLNTPNAPSYYFIAMGMQNTGGYTITIEKVTIDENENVEVIVKEKSPEEGMNVTMAITYPVCSLELSRSPKSIVVKNTEGDAFKKINF